MVIWRCISLSANNCIDDAGELVSLLLDRLDREPLVLEKATASAYYELLTKHFLGPLELALTSRQTQRRLTNLAQGYAVETQEQRGFFLAIFRW